MINISMYNMDATDGSMMQVLSEILGLCSAMVNSKTSSPPAEPPKPEPRVTRMIDFYPTQPGHEFILGTVGQMTI